MIRVQSLYSTSVGKKLTMAVTGAIFVLFVIVHMLGNLKVYLGPEHFNAYAHGLRAMGAPFFGYGQFLWVMRAVLLLAVILHVLAAWQLTRMSWAATGSRYKVRPTLELSYASRTMRWGGVLLALFIVFHILHLTTGSVHSDFIEGDAYHNLVAGFRVPVVSGFYMAAMIALGLHLYHGTWSAFQTLGLDGPRIRRIRRPLAAAIALIVVIGNVSIPIAVLAGFVE